LLEALQRLHRPASGLLPGVPRLHHHRHTATDALPLRGSRRYPDPVASQGD
jgi:hypothetical protein